MLILRFEDAKPSRHNDAVLRHQIIIFIQVVTDAYPCTIGGYPRPSIVVVNKTGHITNEKDLFFLAHDKPFRICTVHDNRKNQVIFTAKRILSTTSLVFPYLIGHPIIFDNKHYPHKQINK